MENALLLAFWAHVMSRRLEAKAYNVNKYNDCGKPIGKLVAYSIMAAHALNWCLVIYMLFTVLRSVINL